MVLRPHLLDAKGRGEHTPPTDEELIKVERGDFVKVCNGVERFWVQILEKKERGYFEGIVMNKLISKNLYTLGTVIQFHSRHVYEIQYSIESHLS